MSKAETITFSQRFFYDGEEITPRQPDLEWVALNTNGSVRVIETMHKIAASASNEAIALDEDSNTVLTVLSDSDGGSDLTIKTNSDSDARDCKPLRILSEPLTALTVSNSSTSAKYLLIKRLVISDTTNVALKERNNAF